MPDEENVHRMWSEDELDRALATLHADVPPGERALARARAELLVAAGEPAKAAPAETAPGVPRQQRRHWGRWVATVAAVVAGVLVVQTVPFGDRRAVSAAVAETLNTAADRIGASDPALKPGQYRYVSTRAWWMASTSGLHKDFAYLAENLIETWVPADPTQEWVMRRDVTGARKWVVGTEAEAKAAGVLSGGGWPEGEERARCGDFYPNEGEQPCRREGSWQQPTPGFLASLPTDPDGMYARITADTRDRGSDPDSEKFVYVADALRSGLVPAQVRATMYRALAKVPGLAVSDRNANLDGRIGVGLGIERDGEKMEIIVDPATGQFIGERHTTTDDDRGVPAGTVTSYTSVTSGVVDQVGDKPRG